MRSVSGAKILSDHLSLFTDLSETVASKPTMAEKAETHRDKVLEMTIEELDLSVRSFNCLKRANINNGGGSDLQEPSEDMMKVRNMGRRVAGRGAEQAGNDGPVPGQRRFRQFNRLTQ